MELNQVMADYVEPALAIMPPAMNSDKARVMLLAIGLQESRFEHTHQIGGPAHSYWQFERAGGVRGVMRHESSKKYAPVLALMRGVEPNERAVFDAMEHDQVLAAAMARLLLWTDPKPLPVIGNSGAAWDLYLRVWRPGKPHPKTWGKLYDKAAFAVMRFKAAA